VQKPVRFRDRFRSRSLEGCDLLCRYQISWKSLLDLLTAACALKTLLVLGKPDVPNMMEVTDAQRKASAGEGRYAHRSHDDLGLGWIQKLFHHDPQTGDRA
jgi:hypothetical protein